MKPFLNKLLILPFLVLFIPSIASAHQPRLVIGNTTMVPDPGISKAYYAELSGAPQEYIVFSKAPFNLYVNITVPDKANQRTNFVISLAKDSGEQPINIDGKTYQWTKFHEPFGYDNYLIGPEYRASSTAGEYKITVSSPDNTGKYSLAIGEAEAFDFKETVNAIKLIPKLKKDFFNESPISFILSPFGIGYIIIMFVLAFVAGFIYRFVLKKLAQKTPRGLHKNIGRSDRLLRALLFVLLFVFAITTTWSPTMLFLAGFCLFEAIFSWCGFYAAIGKNSCPIN